MAEELEGGYNIQHHSNISPFSWLSGKEQPDHKATTKKSAVVQFCIAPDYVPAAPSCPELFPIQVQQGWGEKPELLASVKP